MSTAVFLIIALLCFVLFGNPLLTAFFITLAFLAGAA